MNVSKLRDMLTTSSCVFVPVDDPQKDVLNEIAEVCTYNNALLTIQPSSCSSTHYPQFVLTESSSPAIYHLVLQPATSFCLIPWSVYVTSNCIDNSNAMFNHHLMM